MNRFIKSALLMIVSLGAGTMVASSAVAGEVRIADGDTVALLAAIDNARTSIEATDIVLAPEGTYALSAEPIHLGGTTTLDANGATLHSMYPPEGDANEKGTILRVDAGANISIVDADFAGQFDGWPWLANAGHLALENVTIHGELGIGYTNILPMTGRVRDGILLASGGAGSRLDMRNVTIDLDMEQWNNPVGVPPATVGFSLVSITDGGVAYLEHATMRAGAVFEGNDYVGVAAVLAEQGANPSQVVISNSLVFLDARVADGATAMVSEAPCVHDDVSTISSNGGNIVSDPGCGFGRTVADAGFGSFGDHGGPVPTLSLRGVSPAINAGADAYCLPTDARGYLRGASCDAGAYEFGAALAGGGLGDMGAGGYWNAPDEHGFLAVSFPGSERILLVWSTFDAKGKSATVYGVGDYIDDDTILVADAAVDLPIAGSDPVRVEPVRWGELRLDLESCNEAQFSYQTNMPDFASGTKTLRRLTFFSSVGCSERAH